MIIAVDAGNSFIKIGYFTPKGLVIQEIRTDPAKNAEEYRSEIEHFVSQRDFAKKGDFGVIISSVVAGFDPVLRRAFGRLTGSKKILTAGQRMRSELRFDVRNPERLGSDRIAAAVGAYGRYREAVAVADFGTATTMSLVDPVGNFIGGSIMPGLGLMNESLERETSALKKVSLRPPSSALGKDTTECIRSGIFFGTAGAVERILMEIEETRKINFQLVLTGGHGSVISRYIKRPHEVIPNLTIEGLRLLYEENRSS